jgi:hypothetical protein
MNKDPDLTRAHLPRGARSVVVGATAIYVALTAQEAGAAENPSETASYSQYNQDNTGSPGLLLAANEDASEKPSFGVPQSGKQGNGNAGGRNQDQQQQTSTPSDFPQNSEKPVSFQIPSVSRADSSQDPAPKPTFIPQISRTRDGQPTNPIPSPRGSQLPPAMPGQGPVPGQQPGEQPSSAPPEEPEDPEEPEQPAAAPAPATAPEPAPASPAESAPIPVAQIDNEPEIGDVKPHVRDAANKVVANVPGAAGMTIGGTGHRPNKSDHPAGLGLDYMVGFNNKPLGDAISQFHMDHWDELGVKYIIWEQRIMTSPSSGWEPMEDRGSGTANHFDHPHVSYR